MYREKLMNIVPQHIMIVEDDLLLLMVEERLIKNLGYNVVAKANESKQALRLFKEKCPDILIVDINLDGDLTGIDLVNQMRKEGFNNPVIFLSGEENQVIIEKAMDLGITDYLQKPITVAGLRKSLIRATKLKQRKIHAA